MKTQLISYGRVWNSLRTGWVISFAFTLAALTGRESLALAQERSTAIRICVRDALRALLSEEDTDKDKKITVDDVRVVGTARGNKRF